MDFQPVEASKLRIEAEGSAEVGHEVLHLTCRFMPRMTCAANLAAADCSELTVDPNNRRKGAMREG